MGFGRVFEDGGEVFNHLNDVLFMHRKRESKVEGREGSDYQMREQSITRPLPPKLRTNLDLKNQDSVS